MVGMGTSDVFLHGTISFFLSRVLRQQVAHPKPSTSVMMVVVVVVVVVRTPMQRFRQWEPS